LQIPLGPPEDLVNTFLRNDCKLLLDYVVMYHHAHVLRQSEIGVVFDSHKYSCLQEPIRSFARQLLLIWAEASVPSVIIYTQS
jgi:hypothetical protein